MEFSTCDTMTVVRKFHILEQFRIQILKLLGILSLYQINGFSYTEMHMFGNLVFISFIGFEDQVLLYHAKMYLRGRGDANKENINVFWIECNMIQNNDAFQKILL